MEEKKIATTEIKNPNNMPGARYKSISWIDSSGNLWLLGSSVYITGSSITHDFNDLWKYNPKTNEWTWVSGSDTYWQQGVYGTK